MSGDGRRGAARGLLKGRTPLGRSIAIGSPRRPSWHHRLGSVVDGGTTALRVCVGPAEKQRKNKRFIFESYENALGRFFQSMDGRGPRCPLSEGPCGVGAARPALEFASRGLCQGHHPPLRPINRTPLILERSSLGCCSPCLLAVSSAVTLTVMRIHNLHAGRPQEPGWNSHPPPGLRRSVHGRSTASPPTGVGQSLLLRAPVDGRLFVACLQAARQEGWQASPNGSVQKRQFLLRARAAVAV